MLGWITGHTYVTYGPLLNGATSVIFEGIPFYPSNDRCWQIVQKYKVLIMSDIRGYYLISEKTYQAIKLMVFRCQNFILLQLQ